ncbi:hypothetical protein DWU98_00940 [Dyella monticola]|uniref:Transglycosylase SLT domain-containing protein n=1 Tax=Dyella monticola TaxID=1927958 RepID=A0A370X8H7_9GAMM|nr:transglycosylase SLT domain-containing protein [Dyella monticola]RDS84571.1 hypothetical protein DWU98_00940 [Dyella monticola]
MKRPEVTQRVYLSAPAAFRERRAGGAGERVLLVDPRGWARHRRITQRHRVSSAIPHVAGVVGPQARASWHIKLPFDPSTLLRAMTQRAQSPRAPVMAAGLLAGAAIVMAGVHAWHAQPAVHVVAHAVSAPAVAMAHPAEQPPALPTLPVASKPVQRATASVPKTENTALGLSDDGTIVVVAQPLSSHANGLNLDITSPASLWAKAGARYRIDPVLIYAVALVETRGVQPDGSVAPSPWIVRINGHLHSGTRAETEHAIELANLMAVPVQDVGIMQVYYPMHRDIEPDPVALLNPVRNIEVGTRLLRKAMSETSDPVLRVGYYHSHDQTLARGYGQLVLSVYRELKTAMGRSPSHAVALESEKSSSMHEGG